MPVLPHKNKSLKPARLIVLSFLLVIAVGTLLLIMPFSSTSRSFTNPINALFTATSATCVTGLITYDTASHWSVFGQVVIIAMIQIGGLGLVTFTSFFNFVIGRKLGLRSIQIASESAGSQGFGDVRQLIGNVVKFSLFFEAAGAAVLAIPFVMEQGARGVYTAIFISISAFCNAGFDICGAGRPFCSLTPYADNPAVMIPVILLIISGGLGFVVWSDILAVRKTKHLVLQSKLVLIMTAVLVISGTLIFTLCEWSNPATLAGLSFPQKLTRGLFHSVTLRTAGFNTIDIAQLRPVTKMFSILMMFVGAAPNSTGGGIKVTTLAVAVLAVVSVMRNEEDTIIMGRKIERFTVDKSLVIIVLSACVAAITSLCIYYLNANAGVTVLDAALESVSAFSTCGISSGVTSVAHIPSKLLLTLVMFIGRVGPVSLVYSLTMGRDVSQKSKIVPEGKIMVG